MPEIQVLDQTTIDKIAAGEVVEKPYSVVKELVENAIDAGSTAITVEIKDGGISLIRITDNGCGIEKEQIEMAFLRHSTSKIRKVEDLYTISSLGFRGEALSSISAVAQVELLTKTAGSFIGSRFLINGGKKVSLEEIGVPEGTTIIVRNLFYNTPARKKFLKSATTEGNYIQNLVEKLALSHPEISFKFINNNQIKLQTSGNCNLKDIIYQIYGKDIASNLVEISFESDEAKIKGYIGKPLISRGNRQYENYFVNGRYVKSNIVSKAIENAYKNFLMQHKYPFTVIMASFEGKYVDVNVHPTKMELRFSEEEKVFQLFYHVIFESLSHRELISSDDLENSKDKKNLLKQQNSAKTDKTKPHIPKTAEPFEKKRIEQERAGREALTGENQISQIGNKDIVTQKTEISGEKLSLAGDNKANQNRLREELTGKNKITSVGTYESESKATKALLDKGNENKIVYNKNDVLAHNKDLMPQNKVQYKADEKEAVSQAQVLRETTNYPKVTKQMSMFEEHMVEKSVRDEIKIIGQVFDTYWILEYEDKMYMIDQHAAHEKVLYERMIKLLKNKEFTSQMLNPPLIITVSANEAQVLEEYRSQFEQVGFEIEPFGGKEYAIRAIPGNLYGLNEKSIFLEMLDDISNESMKKTPDTILDKIATMSCKAAVKGNMKLSYSEAAELMKELMELENPYHCPHGRPVIVSISKKEMEKKFKRIV